MQAENMRVLIPGWEALSHEWIMAWYDMVRTIGQCLDGGKGLKCLRQVIEYRKGTSLADIGPQVGRV